MIQHVPIMRPETHIFSPTEALWVLSSSQQVLPRWSKENLQKLVKPAIRVGLNWYDFVASMPIPIWCRPKLLITQIICRKLIDRLFFFYGIYWILSPLPFIVWWPITTSLSQWVFSSTSTHSPPSPSFPEHSPIALMLMYTLPSYKLLHGEEQEHHQHIRAVTWFSNPGICWFNFRVEVELTN